MNFSPDPKNSAPSGDEKNAYASWGAFLGGLFGLLLALRAGHWLANLLLLGTLGTFIGALIDRARR